MSWFKKGCIKEDTIKRIQLLKIDISNLYTERSRLLEGTWGYLGGIHLCVRERNTSTYTPVFTFEHGSDVSPDFIKEVLNRCEDKLTEKRQELIKLGMCPSDVKKI